MRLLRWLCFAATLLSCTARADEFSQPSADYVVTSRVSEVVVEVDYVSGAAPYTGAGSKLSDIWSVTRTNMQRALQGKTITVPSSLREMEELTDVTATTFRSADVLQIAERHRTTISTATLVSYYVVFLNGYFADDAGKVQRNVLGVTVGDSGVIAMFKPVIRSGSSGRDVASTSMFVEQSALVHELGHALGLVNSGIPLSAKHQDTAHGAHCTNERCVMYWLNEGAADATQFVHQYVATGSEVLFGSECLADLDAAAQK